jgi:F-type H+-transporting ATPase subunit b
MWLLKRFLYKPVLKAIDAREKRIADLLTETKQNQKQVEQQQDELRAKNLAFSKEREVLLVKAKTDAEQLKQELLSAASEDVLAQRKKWTQALQKEQDTLNLDIQQRTQDAVFDVARKALKDLSSVELEEQIIQVFIKHLEQLSEQQRQQFLNGAEGSLLIRSAMQLSDENKKALEQNIQRIFTGMSSIHFQLDTRLVSGIELTCSGHKLSWNIDSYLSSLERSITQLVSSKMQDHKAAELEGESSAAIR